MKQQLNICQDTSTTEQRRLQEDIEGLKQQLAAAQLGAQQNKTTSENITASLQRQLEAKDDVISEGKRQNGKLLDEMGRKDELVKSLQDQVHSAEDRAVAIGRDQERRLEELQSSYDGALELVKTKGMVKEVGSTGCLY